MDSVALVLHDYRGRRREAVLLGPTHPLRMVWHAAWAQLAQAWLARARTAEREFVLPTRDAVLRQLTPAGFPPVAPFGEELGRTALLVDNLNPFWSLYAATDEADPRGLVGDVCAALGLPEPSIGGALIDAEVENAEPPAPCDILLGAIGPSPQYGVLGETAGRRVAFDLPDPHHQPVRCSGRR